MSDSDSDDVMIISLSLTRNLKRRIELVCGTNRSRFIRDAARNEVRRQENRQLEELETHEQSTE